MKRKNNSCMILTVWLLLGAAAALTGCGAKGASAGRGSGQGKTVGDVLEANMAEEEATQKLTQTSEEALQTEQKQAQTEALQLTEQLPLQAEDAKADSTENNTGIDVDLTELSSTMVYTEVYTMMSDPDAYRGKTIKMHGNFAVYYTEETDTYYYACIIQDATACCSQGIEFVLDGEYSYPEDYPQLGEEITVEGIFDTYTEGEYTYCTLLHAAML